MIDSPESRSSLSSRAALYLIEGAGVLALVAWIVDRRLGARAFLFGALPLSIVLSTVGATHELRSRLRGDIYDNAGLLARHALTSEARSRTVVVGSEETALYRTMLQIDNPKTLMLLIPAGEKLDAAKLPSDADWVLLVGDHQLPPGTPVQYFMDGFVLFSRPHRSTIHFSQTSLRGLIDRVTGLSGPEEMGCGFDAKEVVIDMVSPLPRRFQLNMKASTFGPNIDLPFVVRIGSASQTFRLPAAMADVPLTFVTNGREREIVIEVFRSTHPSDIGVNRDIRHRGCLTR